MAYIYQIQNDVNDKIYIGKTEFSIEKRWKEHCKDCQNRKYENRPLYSAMRKYGIEHFHISLLEETDFPEEREQYWIDKLNTYKYGYNATKGGDGTRYLDYDLVCSMYNELQNCAEISRILKIDEHSVSKILKIKNIEILRSSEYAKQHYSKPVAKCDLKTGQILETFSSATEAAADIKQNSEYKACLATISGHIRLVCQGKRKTAYKYKWKFI